MVKRKPLPGIPNNNNTNPKPTNLGLDLNRVQRTPINTQNVREIPFFNKTIYTFFQNLQSYSDKFGTSVSIRSDFPTQQQTITKAAYLIPTGLDTFKELSHEHTFTFHPETHTYTLNIHTYDTRYLVMQNGHKMQTERTLINENQFETHHKNHNNLTEAYQVVFNTEAYTIFVQKELEKLGYTRQPDNHPTNPTKNFLNRFKK